MDHLWSLHECLLYQVPPWPQAGANLFSSFDLSAQSRDNIEILYPGERVLKTRQENTIKGIPVDPAIWQQILQL